MYNVLIVDDEQMMRTYLSRNINEICPAFRVTGVASDGLEAIELLKKQHFHLVITDIRMPEMDGLMLAKYIHEAFSSTKVIIISGYDEFEYARTAIKYQVTDYLLKPLNDKNLLEVLINVKEQLDDELNRQSLSSKPQYHMLSDEELKRAMLSAILNRDNDLLLQLYGIMEQRNLSLIDSYGAIMLITIGELELLLKEKDAPDLSTYHLKLNQLCQDYCKDHAYISIYEEHGYTLILLTAVSERGLKNRVYSIYDDISKIAASKELPRVTCTCGRFISDMMELSLSKSDAYTTLALTLKGLKPPIFSDYSPMQEAFLSELNAVCESIYSDYVSFASEKLYSDLKLYCSFFTNDRSFKTLLHYGSYLIRYISSQSNIKATYVKAAFNELYHSRDKYLSSGSLKEGNEHSILLKVVRALAGDKKVTIIPETTRIAEEAKQYILAHYNEQISLSLVADNIGVNASYLSDLLHKELGEPYSKYLLRIRMEQAARLLKNNPNEKIYNIAQKVGFISSKHFISVFKKYYGVTPTSFVEKLAEE